MISAANNEEGAERRRVHGERAPLALLAPPSHGRHRGVRGYVGEMQRRWEDGVITLEGVSLCGASSCPPARFRASFAATRALDSPTFGGAGKDSARAIFTLPLQSLFVLLCLSTTRFFFGSLSLVYYVYHVICLLFLRDWTFFSKSVKEREKQILLGRFVMCNETLSFLAEPTE